MRRARSTVRTLLASHHSFRAADYSFEQTTEELKLFVARSNALKVGRTCDAASFNICRRKS